VKLKGELARGVNDCTHLVAPKVSSTIFYLRNIFIAVCWID